MRTHVKPLKKELVTPKLKLTGTMLQAALIKIIIATMELKVEAVVAGATQRYLWIVLIYPT